MKSLVCPSEEKRKSRTVSTFLKKTYELLNNCQHSDCIRWAPSGIGFIILNQEAFAKTVLPRYFKHSNYSSFVRQLNMYNFHKIRQNSQESYFHHECFTANDRDALADIKRKPEKKKKKNNDSQEEADSEQKAKRVNKPPRAFFYPSQKQVSANSLRKVESEKITQNMFDQEGNCEAIRLPMNQSSDQLSMQVEEEEEKVESSRRLPGVPTRQLISASKNNLIPMSVSVENVQTSILSIFY